MANVTTAFIQTSWVAGSAAQRMDLTVASVTPSHFRAYAKPQIRPPCRVPRSANTYVAAGHSMLGVSQAPGTGKLLSELMTGDKPHIDPTPFRAGRF